MKSYEYKKKKGNLLLFIAVAFIALGYVVFFTSNIWMPKDISQEYFTQLNSNINWDKQTVQIIRWDYCATEQVMEVDLEITNVDYDSINEYAYSAVTRSGKNYECEAVIEKPNWIVARIYGVEDEFGELYFKIQSNSAENSLKIYTNSAAVNRVTSLEKTDEQGYRIIRFKNEIEAYHESITNLENKKSDLAEKNVQLNAAINELKAEEKYQTKEQIDETEAEINNIQSQIKSNLESIADKEEEIKEQQERIAILEKSIEGGE